MKRFLITLTLLFAVVMSSCSNLTGPIDPGVGNVTFTTSVVQNQQMNYFQFVPNTSVTFIAVTASCPQLQVNNAVVNGDSTTIYTATNPIQVGPVSSLAAGQQWTFVVTGKVGNPSGTDYSTTLNYTVTPGPGTGSITFTTSVVQDQQMNSYFQFVPSASVTLLTITASCPQLQINNEVVMGDGMTVYSATNPIQVGPVMGLAAGQQWTFVVVGNIGSSTGISYSTTVNYTTQ